MNSTMPWYQSKSIWGAIVALTATGLGAFFHLTLTADQQSQLVDFVVAIASSLGGILAIYGRITATTQIGSAK